METGFKAISKEFFDRLLAIVYPLDCFICGERIDHKEHDPLCSDCFGKIRKIYPPFCAKCGTPLSAELTPVNICAECRGKHYSFDRAWASTSYEGIMRSCIHSLKYGRHISLGNLLSRILIDFAHRYMDINLFDCIIPVPLHNTKLREREFNQSRLLAQPLAESFNKKLLLNKLIRIKYTLPQSELTSRDREENVRGVFSVNDPQSVKDKNILIVDDVFTTGATLNECASVLKKNGAGRIEVLTLAR